MNTYSIAGLLVNMSPFGKTEKQAEKYLTDFTDNPDIIIEVSEKMVQKYMQLVDINSEDEAYYLASGFAFYRKLLNFGGFMLHSSAICIDEKVYLFSGQSGIGKSTHTGLLKQLLGDRCFVVNDDKPAIRIMENNEVYAFGTPWSGKYDISRNEGYPVLGLCFLGRAESNSITPLDSKNAAIHIMNQCTKNFTESQWDKILGYIDLFVKKVPVYKLLCNKDPAAARLSFKTLTGEEI